nr:putative reverse transcriptase domain-containing protein [Tanacetum cinerariifolium]
SSANLHVPLDEIKIDKTLRFVKEPIEIIDCEVRTLKRSKISLVKVCWNSKRVKSQDEISLRRGYCDTLGLSRDYHPQPDGQSECTIQTLEDMLRAYVIDFGGNWDVHQLSPVLWAEIGESSLIGLELVQETTDKCLADANLHVPLDEIKIDKTLRFVKEPIEIIDREVRTLKRSKISLVKVCWNSKRGLEFT